MEYELLVDRVSLGVQRVTGGQNSEPCIEIRLTESVCKDAGIALLRPVYSYATELLTEDGKLIGSFDETQSAPIGDGCDFTLEHVAIKGGDIYIPLS